MVKKPSQDPKIKFKFAILKIWWLFLPLIFIMDCSNNPYVCQDGDSKDGLKECAQRFIVYAREHQDIQNEAFFLRELASIDVQDKNFSQALQRLINAKKILAESHQTNLELYAEILQAIASSYEHLNNPPQAEKYYMQAIAQTEKRPRNPGSLSSVLQSTAEFYDDQQQYAKAEKLLNRAISLEKEPLIVALQYRTLCKIYEHQNKISQAEACFRNNVNRMESASNLPRMHQKVAEDLRDFLNRKNNRK